MSEFFKALPSALALALFALAFGIPTAAWEYLEHSKHQTVIGALTAILILSFYGIMYLYGAVTIGRWMMGSSEQGW